MRTVREQVLVSVLVGSILLLVAPPIYGRKSLNRPDKIGHRTVAHRSIIAPAKEMEIGKQVAAQFESTVELVRDPLVERYVTSMAEKVVCHSDCKGGITVKVVKSPEVDSFSLPGGFVYLKSRLLLSAENEDEIAGAIAHQVAHAATRSWAAEATAAIFLQLVFIPKIVAPPATAQTTACPGFMSYRQSSVTSAFVSGTLLMPSAFLKDRRQYELEADYLGLRYMYEAGYNPSVYVAQLRKIPPEDAVSQRAPGILQEMPPVSERIAKAEEEIRKILPNAAPPTKLSPEFLLMRSRLQ
jgi:predicted Zn-dependent protease